MAIKYLFLLPAIILLIFFTLWPLGELLIVSMQKTDYITTIFVGFQNYIDIFKSGSFISAGLNSLLYMFWLILLTVFLPLLIALWIWRLPKKWLDASRIIFYLPTFSAGVIISQLWKWIFHIAGPINILIKSTGLEPINFFGNGPIAISTVAIIVSFSGVGGNLIILLAYIQSIDKGILESAQLDGAGWSRISWAIIFPELAKVVGVLSLLSAIGAAQIFETVQQLAPYDYAATMTYRIWLEAFQYSRHGSAAAMAVVFLIVMVGMALLKNKVADEN